MDSISENVVAMIAVVVGILIIGTALVPIVQHASEGEGETVTGTNQVDIDAGGYYLMITDTTRYVLTIGSESATINGLEVSELTVKEMVTDNTVLDLTLPGTYTISGTAITGGTTYTLTAAAFPMIAVTDADHDTSIALDVPNAVVGVFSEQITAGPGQSVGWSSGTIRNGVILDSNGEPADTSEVDWIIVTENDNGTWTISDDGDAFAGPQTWTGRTAGGTSQYAALYGIIPIMCILAMAYVLIRRF